MECFWGKLKQEWLNEQHFKTRDEAKKQYLNIFGYSTTEKEFMRQMAT